MRWNRLAPILIALWVVANYSASACSGFVNDDAVWVYGAVAPRKLASFLRPEGPMGDDFLRPIVQLSFVADWYAGGTSPCVYGATNVALHALACIAYWYAASAVAGSTTLGLLAALLFAVHPTRPEAVTWISGRTELLSGAFVFASLATFLRGRIAASTVLYATAWLCKESAVAVPLLLVAAEALRLRDERRDWRKVVPAVVVTVLYLGARVVVVPNFAPGVVGVDPLQPPLSLASAAALLRSKITIIGGFMAAPLPLHGFLRSLSAMVAVVGVTLWVARASTPRTGRAMRFCLCWMVISALPYAAWATFMSWYMYTVVGGFCLLLVLLGVAATSRLQSRLAPFAAAAAYAAWMLWSVGALQAEITRHRTAAESTRAVVDGIVAAEPAPTLATIFRLEGLSPLILGADASGKPILVNGLTEALRLVYGKESLVSVQYADPSRAPPASDGRPMVTLQWDPVTRTMQRR